MLRSSTSTRRAMRPHVAQRIVGTSPASATTSRPVLGLEQQPQAAAHDRVIVGEHERDAPGVARPRVGFGHGHIIADDAAFRWARAP